MSVFQKGRFKAVSVLSKDLPEHLLDFWQRVFAIYPIIYPNEFEVNVPNTYFVDLGDYGLHIVHDESEHGDYDDFLSNMSTCFYAVLEDRKFKGEVDFPSISTEDELCEKIYEIYKEEEEEVLGKLTASRRTKLYEFLEIGKDKGMFRNITLFGNFFWLIHVREEFEHPTKEQSDSILEILTEDCEYMFVKKSDQHTDDPNRMLEHDLVWLYQNGEFSRHIDRMDISSQPYVIRVKEKDDFSNIMFRQEVGFVNLKCKWYVEPGEDLAKECNMAVLINTNSQYMGEPNMSKYIGEFNPMRDMRRIRDELVKHEWFKDLPPDALTYTRIKKHIWDLNIKCAEVCAGQKRYVWLTMLEQDLKDRLTCHWRLLSPDWELDFGLPTNSEVDRHRDDHDKWMSIYGNIDWQNSDQSPDSDRKTKQIEKMKEDMDGKS